MVSTLAVQNSQSVAETWPPVPRPTARPFARAVLLLLLNNNDAIASRYDVLDYHPGTRGLGMAGVFIAQANDSSAIWYNPAGLSHKGSIKRDVSIELARGPRIASDDATVEDADVDFIGVYSDHISLGDWRAEWIGIGAAYFVPYRMRVDVNKPATPLNTTTFGSIDTTYRQISLLLGGHDSSQWSWGGTVDAVWTDIACRDYSPCVDNGPWGVSWSAGLLYDAKHVGNTIWHVGALWRGSARLDYTTAPDTGIGTVLNDYVPHRPETRALGVGMRAPLSDAYLYANVLVEDVLWSRSASVLNLSDRRSMGVSGELLVPLHGASMALRLGMRRSEARGGDGGNTRTLATGAGYAFMQRHVVDFGIEQRMADRHDVSVGSISYSYQP